MRIVIDIDRDQVRVHRVIGDELAPAAVLEEAAALHAESAGLAMVPGGVASLATAEVQATDAGRAPSSPRSTGKAAHPDAVTRAARRSAVPKQQATRRRRR